MLMKFINKSYSPTPFSILKVPIANLNSNNQENLFYLQTYGDKFEFFDSYKVFLHYPTSNPLPTSCKMTKGSALYTNKFQFWRVFFEITYLIARILSGKNTDSLLYFMTNTIMTGFSEREVQSHLTKNIFRLTDWHSLQILININS